MEQRIKEGPPVWVESLMTLEEYKEYCRKHPSVTNPKGTKIADFNNPEHGRWRYKMGGTYTPEEIRAFNKSIDNLINLLKTKKFQKRPDYGPENEAKP